jgi:hypothetical protein
MAGIGLAVGSAGIGAGEVGSGVGVDVSCAIDSVGGIAVAVSPEGILQAEMMMSIQSRVTIFFIFPPKKKTINPI